MNLDRIAPGKAQHFVAVVPKGVTRHDLQAALEIEGYCGCGKQLARRRIHIWACPAYRWWQKWIPWAEGHACLSVDIR